MPLAICVALLAVLQVPPQDPVLHQGRPLSEWVEDLGHKKSDKVYAAKRALEAIGKPAVPALLPLVSSPRKETRQAALDALGAIGDTTAVPAIIAALSDPEREVRGAAVRALGGSKDERAVDPLLERLNVPTSDKDFDGYAEIRVLARIGSPRAIARLQELSRSDPRPRARAAVLDALTQWRHDPSLIDTYGAGLKDPDAGVRREATLGLSRYDSPRVIELLESAAADPSLGDLASKALRDVDTRGKPSETVGGLLVTFLDIETADRWGSWPQQYTAKRGYDLVIVRYRVRWAEGSKGDVESVHLFDATGTELPTAVAASGRFGFSSLGQRAAGEAITAEAAFAAKKDTKFSKCTIQGATFDLSSVVPTPRKD